MRVWKNVLVGVGVFVLLVAAVLGGIDAYPYFQGKSFAVQIPNTQVIIQAGKVPLSSYTPDVEAAFSKTVSKYGAVILAPLHVDNMIFDKWDEANYELYAHDIVTNQQKLCYWMPEIALVCVYTKDLVFIPPAGSKFTPPDIKTTLDKFF